MVNFTCHVRFHSHVISLFVCLICSLVIIRILFLQFRLKSLPVKQRIYIIEGSSHSSLPLSTLMQAGCNTQLIDGFIVKYTKDFHNTLKYISSLTRKFKHLLYVSN